MPILDSKISRLVCFAVAFHFCNASAGIAEIKIEGDKLNVKTDSARSFISMRLKGTVIGYDVNCAKSKLIIWGVPKELDSNSPQIGFIMLADGTNPHAIRRRIVGQGVMEIKFLENKKYALAISNSAFLMNLENGKIEYLPIDENLEKFPQEKCRKASWQTFRKY